MSRQKKLHVRSGPAVRLLIVLGGLAAAVVTVAARRAGVWELAKAGAVASLVFALLMLVFVVPPLARSARAEAGRFNPPFQVTGGGLIFLGIFSVVAFSAWNTGNNLLFLVFSVLASTLFVAWTAGRSSLRDLVVSARFPDHIFAGEAAPVIVTLHNTKRVLPSFSILVEARSRADEEGDRGARRWRARRALFRNLPLAYFMYAPRGARVEQRVEQTFERRGHVLVTGFEISTRFPFGFFRLSRRLRARNVDLIIYPRPLPASDELHLLPINAGRVASVRRGAGHDLHSLRDYQPQDDMRHIDWKATARASRLTVREFTSEDERRVHVMLDTRAANEEAESGGRGETEEGRGQSSGNKGREEKLSEGGAAEFAARFERGVTLAASLVKHFIDERAEVRLTLGGETGRYGEGREHLYASLRRLALLAPSHTNETDAETPEEFWHRASLAAAESYMILLTAAPRGSVPPQVWRKSHVIHL